MYFFQEVRVDQPSYKPLQPEVVNASAAPDSTVKPQEVKKVVAIPEAKKIEIPVSKQPEPVSQNQDSSPGGYWSSWLNYITRPKTGKAK
jgi:hypothetical protein